MNWLGINILIKLRKGLCEMMRLLIELKSNQSFSYKELNNYVISSFIWECLRDTEYSSMHDKKEFKYFSFSNVFPVKNKIKQEEKVSFIISSPSGNFIKTLKKVFPEMVWFNNLEFETLKLKVIKSKIGVEWETASPIVLYKDNKKNLYVKANRGDTLLFFKRLKDNALKKYNSYYNDELEIDNLFESYVFRKQVAIQLEKNKQKFIIIGSHWRLLLPLEIKYQKVYKKLYRFIYEAGLGEKNSLGFGFVNSKRA